MNKTKSNSSSIASTNSIGNQKRSTGKIEQILTGFPFYLKNKPVVAVLRLSGVIGKVSSYKNGLTIENLNELIEKSFGIQKLIALCLAINSPGGSPVQSELIAKRIIDLSKEKNIPVYSFVEDVAASGGYWLACAGNKIYASRSSIIGSVGVVSSSFGFQEAIGKLGIERRIYTEGKNKSILDPFQPVRAEDIKIIKKLQKQIHGHFINYVKERRGGRLTQNDEVLFNGEFWAGDNALDFGLIDGIADMYGFIKENFGEDIKIEHITPKQSWFKKKLGMNMNAEAISEEIVSKAVETVENKLIKSKFNLF